jgi:hypothetical protein
VASPGESISIIDADPELCDLLPADERERAQRETRTRLRRLSPGAWNVAESVEPDSHTAAF